MELDTVTPSAVLTVAGASIVLTILMQAILAALKLSAALRDRFAPLLALALGVVVVGSFAVYQSADLAAAVLTGLIAGSASMGVYDTTRGLTR